MNVFARVPGLLVLVILATLTLVGAASSPAAMPSSGTIGPTPGSSTSWMGQPYPTGHAVPVPQACPPPDPSVLCDHFQLTVNVAPSYWDTHTGGADVSIEWASPDDDFDLYVYDNSGTQVGFSAAGGTTSERAFIQNASLAGSPYEVRVVPFLIVSPGLVGHDGTATFVSQAGGPAPNPVRSTGGLAFSPPATVVDAQRTEGEPVNFIDKDGNYWESGPYGFSTAQSWIHRSTDGGDQFNIVSLVGLRPNAPPGGGDTDVVVDDQGDAYFVDLEGLAELSCAFSEDNGNNWTTNQACVLDTVVDRQWFAVDNGLDAGPVGNTVFLAYRQTPRGSFIYSTPGADDGGGALYLNSSADLGNPVSQGAPCGQMRFDPVKRNLYYPCIQGDHVEITVGHVLAGQRTSIHYSNVQAPVSPGGGPVGDLFPSVATDAAGNLYAVWIDETDHNVYYAAATANSITFDIAGDAHVTWGPVQQINGNDANSNEFMWAQGGAAGTLAVVWLGNSSHLDSDFMPSWYNNRQAATQFKWFGYASLIRNATSATPTFAQTKFTDQPSHYGQICNQGLFCTVSMGDRTMADYFSLYLDRDGSMRIVFNDTTSQHHGAHVFEVRQVAGPSAIGTTISKVVPKNPVTDPTGDAQSPHYSPGGTGVNQPHLDFTKLELSKPNASTLRVKMTLAAPPTPGLVPFGETSNVWLTRFQALSVGDEGEESYRIFYVGAESAGGIATPTFFAGSGRSANNAVPGNGCTTTTPENCKIVQYPSEVVVTTGSISGNVITIDVPLQGGFGANRPIFGNTLYNVTALSAGRGNAGAEISDIYADVDATRSFDFAVTGQLPPPEGGCKITGGGANAFGSFSLNVHENLNGKVDYRDDAAAVNLRSTRITAVHCNLGAHTARIQGEGINNGDPVTFTVDVIDNGEAGSSDVFQIMLSSGYTRSGTLTRGNIQVHE
jgi:hypothetical protein